jgi:hypothetical protein
MRRKRGAGRTRVCCPLPSRPPAHAQGVPVPAVAVLGSGQHGPGPGEALACLRGRLDSACATAWPQAYVTWYVARAGGTCARRPYHHSDPQAKWLPFRSDACLFCSSHVRAFVDPLRAAGAPDPAAAATAAAGDGAAGRAAAAGAAGGASGGAGAGGRWPAHCGVWHRRRRGSGGRWRGNIRPGGGHGAAGDCPHRPGGSGLQCACAS